MILKNFNHNIFYEMYIFFNLKNTIENRKFNFFPEYVKYELNASMQNCSLQ